MAAIVLQLEWLVDELSQSQHPIETKSNGFGAALLLLLTTDLSNLSSSVHLLKWFLPLMLIRPQMDAAGLAEIKARHVER